MRCEHCGSELKDSDKFCPECGQAPANDSSKSNRRAIPIPLLVVLVLALLAGAIFAAIYVYNDLAAQPEEQTEQANEETESIEPIEQVEKAPVEVTYTYKLASQTVSVGAKANNADGWDPAGSTATWTYPVFSSTGGDQAKIDVVNRIAKGHFDDMVAQNAEYGDIQTYNTEVTYQNDSIFSTATYKRFWAGGVSNILYETHIYDLSSGKEISAESYLGISKSELNSLMRTALDVWVPAHSDQCSISSSELYNNLSERDESELFYLCDEGLALVTEAYDLGYGGGNVVSILVHSSGSTKAGADLEMPAVPR